jgi:anti-sigma B factor antagonist
MEIRERELDGIKVLDLEGKIASGEGDTKLKRCILDLVAAGHDRLVINLGGVPYMDSSGLGELVRCFTSVQRTGGRLKLTNLSRRLTDLLTITKLITIFDTHPTDADAVRAFKDGAE